MTVESGRTAAPWGFAISALQLSFRFPNQRKAAWVGLMLKRASRWLNDHGTITEEEALNMVRPSDVLAPESGWWASLWSAFKTSGLRSEIRETGRLPGETRKRYETVWFPTQDWRPRDGA